MPAALLFVAGHIIDLESSPKTLVFRRGQMAEERGGTDQDLISWLSPNPVDKTARHQMTTLVSVLFIFVCRKYQEFFVTREKKKLK